MSGSITLIPDTISFGSLDVGATGSASLNIKALGFGPFNISSVSNSDTQFASNMIPGPLNTGDNHFTVTFSPASAAPFSDTFVIMIFNGFDTSTTEFDLPVDGTGASPSPPPVGSFVSVIQTD